MSMLLKECLHKSSGSGSDLTPASQSSAGLQRQLGSSGCADAVDEGLFEGNTFIHLIVDKSVAARELCFSCDGAPL